MATQPLAKSVELSSADLASKNGKAEKTVLETCYTEQDALNSVTQCNDGMGVKEAPPPATPGGTTFETASAVAGAEATTTEPQHITAIDNCDRPAEVQCVQFTSPNSGEMMTIEEAQARLRSDRHLVAKQSADVLDKELGLKPQSHDAIGLCPDGAENSIMTVCSATDSGIARYANAVKGRALAQKSVITFSDAPDAHHEFLVPLEKASLREVQVALCERGIVYDTLVSDPRGTRVAIIDKNGKYGDQIKAAANHFGADDVARWGKAEFDGVENTDGLSDSEARDKASLLFDKVIFEYESKHPEAAECRQRFEERLKA
jgi:hypothetical protein